ncbi:hypothetical protein Pan216_34180 [Planctomycetes bacterium Pan216]|uniref:Uncharacterized protein n=1 Tax=Kolteria novifilia TaxID=2527975 RepID=A0A518B6E4_9BACT|nr:hypothetical protein Pan216_34180 [Planctomycetes bacterium Pan216]
MPFPGPTSRPDRIVPSLRPVGYPFGESALASDNDREFVPKST